MSTWKPISKAPKDRPIDLWTGDGLHLTRRIWSGYGFEWASHEVRQKIEPTHWREPDKGPGQEEGEVRWMVAFDFLDRLGEWVYKTAEEAQATVLECQKIQAGARVVRVRIVREEE